MFLLVKVVLVSIRTKFELSRCLVCPTIEINICSIPLIKSGSKHTRKHTDTQINRKMTLLLRRGVMKMVLFGVVWFSFGRFDLVLFYFKWIALVLWFGLPEFLLFGLF